MSLISNCLFNSCYEECGVEYRLNKDCPFNIDELDNFFSLKDIPKERLICILNKITENPHGKELLAILKNDLGVKKKKISFVITDDTYAFVSERTINSNNKEYNS